MGKAIKEIDGLPVIDAVRPLKVTVTDKDIQRADVKEPTSCAFARACRRELHIQEARVHLSRVYLKPFKGKCWTRYLAPDSLRSEIIAFDRGGRFVGGEFILHKPYKTKKLGQSTGGQKRGPNSKRKKQRGHTQIRDVRGSPA